MRRIILTTGGVETLTFFARQLGAEFDKMGYGVFFFDLKNAAASAKKARKFIRPGETALVTFSFQGLEQEDGVFRERSGYLWDEYALPCFNITADHPYFYHDRFFSLPKRYFHISIDRNHQSYVETFYPQIHSLGFLPLAGTALELPPCDRVFDVIMTGNYTELSFFDRYIHWVNDEYATFYQGIIDDLLTRTDRTVEEVAQEHCRREMGDSSPEDMRLALHKMIFIDMYVRNYWRGKAVAALADAGVRVDVVGNGWEKLPVKRPENLVIHPQTDSLSCLRMLQASKVSLNVMPWFKDGAHDRVFNSVLNGAVCLSDTSRYLCGELAEGQGVSYYSLSELSALPERAARLLSDDGLRAQMLSAGQAVVKERHTWSCRAHHIAEWLVAELSSI